MDLGRWRVERSVNRLAGEADLHLFNFLFQR